MCSASHGYGVLDGGRMDEVGGMHVGQAGLMSGDAGALPECEVIH